MEFQEVVRRRRMVRRFTGEPVAQQSLDRILANAVKGPSAGFSQGQAFLVLTGLDLAEFWKVTGEPDSQTAENAPLIIVPLSCKRVYLDRYALPDKGWTDRDEARWPVPFWHIDTGMAALLILQTAVDEGLGAVYFGIVPEAVGAFRDRFGVPADYEPIGAIAIGHDAEEQRRDLSSPAQAAVRAGALQHLVSSSHKRAREQEIGDDTGQHHRDANDGVGEAVAGMVNASSLRFRAEVVCVIQANPKSGSTLVAEIRCRNASRGDHRRARAVRQRRVPSGQEQAGQR